MLKEGGTTNDNLKQALRKGVGINDFSKKIKDSYHTKITKKLTDSERSKEKSDKTKYENLLDALIEIEKKTQLTDKQKKDKKDLEKKIYIIEKKLNPTSKYTETDIENIVIELNKYLKNMIEQYKTRILFRADENFGNEKCSVIDFFTGTKDVSKISNSYTKNKKNDENKSITFIQIYMMMYEAYREYYKTYSIETIIKSFSKDTIKKDNETKMSILNGLGLYSVIVYNKIKQVRDTIKGILLHSSPDFEKAKTMLTKVQTLINSSPDEAKKNKLLKIKKNIEEQINKLAENKKNNRGQNRKNTYGNKKPFNKGNDNKKPWEKKNKFGEKKPFEKKEYSKYSKYNND